MTYKPHTLMKSSKLANKSNPSRASLNVEDRLLRQKLDYEAKIKEKKD